MDPTFTTDFRIVPGRPLPHCDRVCAQRPYMPSVLQPYNAHRVLWWRTYTNNIISNVLRVTQWALWG